MTYGWRNGGIGRNNILSQQPKLRQIQNKTRKHFFSRKLAVKTSNNLQTRGYVKSKFCPLSQRNVEVPLKYRRDEEANELLFGPEISKKENMIWE